MGALKSTIPFGLHPSSLESLKQPASNKQNKQNSTHSTHTTRPVRWCLAYPWCRLKKSALVFCDGVRPRSRITAITADHPQIIVRFSAQPHFICVIQTITSHLTYPVHNQILFLTDELCLTTTFRRNPPFTWCSVFVEVCRERLRQREAERGWGRERQREAESRSVSDKRMGVLRSPVPFTDSSPASGVTSQWTDAIDMVVSVAAGSERGRTSMLQASTLLMNCKLLRGGEWVAKRESWSGFGIWDSIRDLWCE